MTGGDNCSNRSTAVEGGGARLEEQGESVNRGGGEMAKYKRIQFVAFNIQPGTKTITKKSGSGPPVAEEVYLGKSEASADIEKRCKIMKAAIETAHRMVQQAERAQKPVARAVKNTINLDVPLKVFMAPEFFFRGAEGGYPIEKIFDIQDNMRKETSKDKYSDWLFVLGTAIGYQKRGGTPTKLPPEHAFSVVRTGVVGGYVELEIEDTKNKCSRVKPGWTVKQGTVSAKVTALKPLGPGKYKVKTDIPVAPPPPPSKRFVSPAAATLVEPPPPAEPEGTEIWNVAMVQKGGPRPAKDDGQVRETVVFKEVISAIDFLGPNYNDVDAWFEKSGLGRLVKLHGDPNRRVVPTEGSTDLLSPVANKPGTSRAYRDANFVQQQQQISEVNVKGGGGSVFTIDDINFGLEVCLDHLERRLKNFYDKAAKPSDPKLQVQLIPSWGMSIMPPSICVIKNGLVFNVDGDRVDSDACETTGGMVCEICKKAGHQCDRYYCKKCKDKVHDTSGPCPNKCGNTLEFYEKAALVPKTQPVNRKAGPTTVEMSGFDKITVTQKEYYTGKGHIVLYEPKPIPVLAPKPPPKPVMLAKAKSPPPMHVPSRPLPKPPAKPPAKPLPKPPVGGVKVI